MLLTIAQLLILIFSAIIAWMTYRSNLLLKEIELDFNVLLSLPETISRLVFIVVCLFLAWLSGLSRYQLGLTVTNVWWSVGIGALTGLITQLAVNVITIQSIKHFGPHIYSSWLIRNIIPQRRSQWFWLALAFIPPVIMEELLFRSLLIGGFQNIIPLPALVISTSILFGFMHLPQGKLGMIMAGTINVFFSLLFIWTGELLVTIVAHYTVNVLQVVVASKNIDRLPA